MHYYLDLIAIFEQCFGASYNTRLVKGDDEPIYLPADHTCQYHRIIFAHGYFASALHEVAHWCIAGSKRRQQQDYGYWYCPDGRDAQQQAEFEQVEVKPQAIEYAFSQAAGCKFRVSTDNLNGCDVDAEAFAFKVERQYHQYVAQGFPVRAAMFIQALERFYQPKVNSASGHGCHQYESEDANV